MLGEQPLEASGAICVRSARFAVLSLASAHFYCLQHASITFSRLLRNLAHQNFTITASDARRAASPA
ncbi:unnamed protein product [Caenorhabditis sp. 36 PRJEB53466]|nr:unnamed protein product [Caenorhabditis sp. 36 PRJEB53466]